MEVLSLLHRLAERDYGAHPKKYIPDRKRPGAVEVVGLPIELEGDDYVALARKVEAAVRAL
jgi:hypothetical protein